jgi:transcriptional regulator with XRE-family HTH domain
MMDKKQLVAEKLKDRLKALNINRQQFADIMKVQPSIVTKWLSGTHNFTIETISKIEQALIYPIIIYKNMDQKELHLKQIQSYAVVASTDERSSGIFGYYSDYNAASINTKGVGWYGSDGNVEAKTVYYDGEQIYEVKPLGKFKDIDENEKKAMIDRIKSKLTPEEWEFYNNNPTPNNK